MKTLLTVLGTGRYVFCNYGELKRIRFIQEAIIRKDPEIKRVVVFATKKSKEINWNKGSMNNNESMYEAEKHIGLKETFDNTIRKGYNFNYELVEILEGYDEQEVWKNFNIISEKVSENEEVVLDITHGFRYLPFLVMTIMNYLKLTKNVKIDSIEYGVFENLGNAFEVAQMKPEDRNGSIMNLNYLDYLNDFISGTDMFIKTGSVSKLSKIANNNIAKMKKRDEMSINMKKCVDKIEKVNKDILTCRSADLNRDIKSSKEVIKSVNETESRLDDKMLPFLGLMKKVDEKLSVFKFEDEISNYFLAVKWCYEHNFAQQGFTILRENIISFILKDNGFEYKTENERRIGEETINYLAKMKELGNEIEKGSNVSDELIEAINEKYETIVKIYCGIRDMRNDINHFGCRNSPQKAESINAKLKKYYNKLADVIENFEQDFGLIE